MNYQKIINESQTKSEVIKKIFGYHNGKTQLKFDDLVEKERLVISNLRKRSLKYEIVKKKCPVCDEEFETQKNHPREKATCSYSCSNTYFRSGESNGNWKDWEEYDKRDGYLSKKYRKVCFDHHPHKCVACDEDKVLDVHHFDEDKYNNTPENLIPMCPTHHRYWHSPYRKEIEDKVIKYINDFINKG